MVNFPGFPPAHVLTRFLLLLATTCCKAEEQKTLHPEDPRPDPCSPRMSPGEVALIVIVPSQGLLIGIYFFLRRDCRAKWKRRRKAGTTWVDLEEQKALYPEEPLSPRMSPREVALTATVYVLGLLLIVVICLLWREHRDKQKWKKEAEEQKALYPEDPRPDPCSPGMSPGEVALTVIVLALGLLLIAICCFLRRDSIAKWKRRRNADTTWVELDSLREENCALREEIQKLRADIDERKAQFHNDWRNSSLYPDWRKAFFKAGEVLLDADTAHCNLILSEDRRCVTWGENPQERPDNRQRFYSLPCVLGQQHFTSGSCYWEVEVDESRAWDLGVCRDNVMRKGRVVIKPENGFWVIRFYKDEYWALTAPETQLTLRNRTTRVCIFLEYERGCISFYDMTDNSHIHTFSQCSFFGSLRPLFRLWSRDSGQLRICPVQSNTN